MQWEPGSPVWVQKLAIIACLALLPQGQSTHHRVAENTLTKLSTTRSANQHSALGVFRFFLFQMSAWIVTGEEAYVTLPLEVCQYPCLVGKHYGARIF